MNFLDVVHHLLCQPLVELFNPVLDGVHWAEDEDCPDLLWEVLHDSVNEPDGLEGLTQAHAVRQDGATGNLSIKNVLQKH